MAEQKSHAEEFGVEEALQFCNRYLRAPSDTQIAEQALRNFATQLQAQRGKEDMGEFVGGAASQFRALAPSQRQELVALFSRASREQKDPAVRHAFASLCARLLPGSTDSGNARQPGKETATKREFQKLAARSRAAPAPLMIKTKQTQSEAIRAEGRKTSLSEMQKRLPSRQKSPV